jgi:putative transposase
VNELWQTDFTYFKLQGWGWYYLSTVLDDYSRYILAWRLTPTMEATDVQLTLEAALAAAGLATRVRVRHRPRLLSDNGPAYLSAQLREFLQQQGMEHTRGAPFHPMTQGKIERYHRSMKNIVELVNYFDPWTLERALARWVDYYNHQRYHESLDNVTPADQYFGRAQAVQTRREAIKLQTLAARRQQHRPVLLAVGA